MENYWKLIAESDCWYKHITVIWPRGQNEFLSPQVLEAQIIERDNLAAGTTFAVKSLDHKNMTGIGDLRGRVARS